jgi:hypothetical protein
VKIRSVLIPAVALVFATASAAAQAAQAPVRQDSTGYEATLLTLRDSVAQVRAELSRFRRDLQMAGAQTVVGRARRLGTACTGLRASLSASSNRLRTPASATPGVRSASRDLLTQMRRADQLLAGDCERGLAPEGPGVHADSLKAWGPHRTSQLEKGLNELDGAIAAFARAAEIELKPRLP